MNYYLHCMVMLSILSFSCRETKEINLVGLWSLNYSVENPTYFELAFTEGETYFITKCNKRVPPKNVSRTYLLEDNKIIFDDNGANPQEAYIENYSGNSFDLVSIQIDTFRQSFNKVKTENISWPAVIENSDTIGIRTFQTHLLNREIEFMKENKRSQESDFERARREHKEALDFFYKMKKEQSNQ